MTAPELLALLRKVGFTFTAESGRLLVSPASRLTADERAAIAVHKADILEILAAGPVLAVGGPSGPKARGPAVWVCLPS